ncbi:MAG: hypothetical protein JRJ69_16615 [Deltaproteobacteria bacterium]|nr:hypothetical protein [Deltaproteobacteria bacterium]MBW1739106.1 hypothetical protein [Deltaproteobacteria bacterium]MBW1908497.1 hypothetical protein [Deltaproteobacteria bacterium]MBW2032903.1 hypothetical protein [Deltaproteobacteria bacterium]MBW2114876.1 hypothetical protein [Deltaproteobacteria bacterium]
MSNIKRQISEWLNVAQETLNEIELEDIEFAEFAQQNINNAVAQMLSLNNNIILSSEQAMPRTKGIPCKGFWVENTKDLVLYVLNGNQSKAIVVPKQGWMIKDGITIN